MNTSRKRKSKWHTCVWTWVCVHQSLEQCTCQTQWDYVTRPLEWLKWQRKHQVCQAYGTIGGYVNQYNHFRKLLYIILSISNSSPRFYSTEMYASVHQRWCINLDYMKLPFFRNCLQFRMVQSTGMLITALLVIGEDQQPPKCPPTVKWLNKLWCVTQRDIVRRNRWQLHVRIHVNLTKITLSKGSLSQKTMDYMSPFI